MINNAEDAQSPVRPGHFGQVIPLHRPSRPRCPVFCTSEHPEAADELLSSCRDHRTPVGEVALTDGGTATLDLVRFDGPADAGHIHLELNGEPIDDEQVERLAHVLLAGLHRVQLARKGQKSMTWLDVLELLAERDRVRGLRGTEKIRRQAVHRLRAFLGYDPLEAVEADLRRWQSWMVDRGLSLNYQCGELAHVRAFFTFAYDEEMIATNPARRLPTPKVPRRLPRPIGEHDLDRAIQQAPARIRPWLVLAAGAGLRAKEISQLAREDILDEGVTSQPVIVIRDGKGGKDRTVPLAPDVWRELQQCDLPRRGHLFSRCDGQPGAVNAKLVSKQCNRHLHRLGIVDTLHSLRHRFGTVVYQECRDLRLVQELMGHESPQTTSGYTAFAPERAAPAVYAAAAKLLHPAVTVA